MANVNPLEETGIVVGHYLQSITQRLALGAELLYHYGQGQQAAIVSLAGKYTSKYVVYKYLMLLREIVHCFPNQRAFNICLYTDHF